jgi:hypothetical protein
VRKRLIVDLPNLLKHIIEALFTSTMGVQPGVLFLLFFAGLMLGWLFGH